VFSLKRVLSGLECVLWTILCLIIKRFRDGPPDIFCWQWRLKWSAAPYSQFLPLRASVSPPSLVHEVALNPPPLAPCIHAPPCRGVDRARALERREGLREAGVLTCGRWAGGAKKQDPNQVRTARVLHACALTRERMHIPIACDEIVVGWQERQCALYSAHTRNRKPKPCTQTPKPQVVTLNPGR